jgi:hypothetical protein
MAKRSLALLLMCLGAFLMMPVLAQADTTDIIESQNETLEKENGFQAGTCYENQEGEDANPNTPDLGKPYCSAETEPLFFTQAGGHPPFGFTQYIIQHEDSMGKIEPIEVEVPTKPIKEPIPDRTIKTLRVDLPPGLTVNPQATPHCSKADFEAIGQIPGAPMGAMGRVPKCAPETVVGREEVTVVTNVEDYEAPTQPGVKLPKGYVINPSPATGTYVPVYNIEPEPGEPARLGFVIAFEKVIYLETEVAWENDFHESFTIKLPEAGKLSTLVSRLVSYGQAGDGTYITNPTTCFDPNQWTNLYSTWFRAHSYGDEDPVFPAGSTPVEAELPEGMEATGCENIPFDPGIDVDPGTNAIDSPAPATVTATLPFDPAKEGGEVEEVSPGVFEGISQSHVRSAEVTMPKGMGLNPAGANGLKACLDSQFRKGQRVYENACPPESDIGSVVVDSPPLAEPLVGDVYVGEQKSSDPASGELFRILIEAKNKDEGVAARLVGNVKADPQTGQLTAVLTDRITGQFAGTLPDGLPQVPFESVKLRFDGSKAVLTSPPTCSPSATAALMEPWARPGEKKPIGDTFTLSTDPNGGSCPQTLAERKFAPSYKAATDSTKAGAYSPFHVRIARADGQQELKVVDVTLPKGLTGKLRGIPYCPEGVIAAIRNKSGTAETANPGCPGDSFLGAATTLSGSGNNPLKLPGNVYLAGPYKGAPLSLVVTTPALAGPFDLGTVLVRVATHVDPETAQIRAVSDVIPDVFGGVKLDLRSIDIDIYRKKFMLNPTNCKEGATAGTIQGGGADPTNPAAFSSYAVSDPFQATQCNKLGFKPKLKVKLFGPTQRTKFPRLKAVLTAPKGQANVARTALTMPSSLFLEQAHIGTVCTRPELAAHNCPKASVYGKGWAKSPLLKNPLKGKAYLVSSNNELPDLLVDLRGQVDIHLRGVISSGKGGGLKTVFRNVPDVPVSKFVLNMKGGKKSLLVNSENTCKKTQRGVLNIKGQNGKKVKNNKFKLNVVDCGKKKGKK